MTLNGTGIFASVNVAPGIAVTSTSTLGGASASNYTLTQPAGLSANITPKPLGITADGKVKAKDTGDPPLTYMASGLIGGDSISGGLTRNSGETPGTYAITQGTIDAGLNYSINYTAGTLVITGPLAAADPAITRPANSINIKIPKTTLLGNDQRVDTNGTTISGGAGLDISAVTAGMGNTVTMSGVFVVYTPATRTAGDPLTFTYTASDGTSTDTATVTVSTNPATFSLQFISRTTAVFSGGQTSITVTFLTIPNQALALEYSTIAMPVWTSAGSVNSGASGWFSVVITAAGDHAADWNQSMLFQATR